MSDDFNTQHKLETYKSMVTISIEAFKYLSLLNSGVVIAFLTFANGVAQRTSHMPLIQPAMTAFLFSSTATALFILFSYLTQFCLFNESFARFWKGTHVVFVVLAVVSFLASVASFICGTMRAATLLQ